MSNEIKTIIFSGFLSLGVSRISFHWQNKKEKKVDKKKLETNFIILIKDIENLLSYLKKIIEDREILKKPPLKDFNYNQILINYNNIYGDKDGIISVLLEFYDIRTEIKIHLQKIEEYQDEFYYINFIEEIYKKLEILFVADKLQIKLQRWNDKFEFETLSNIKENKEKELENEISFLINKNDINFTKDNQQKEVESLLNNINALDAHYDDMEERYKTDSLERICSNIFDKIKKLYKLRESL